MAIFNPGGQVSVMPRAPQAPDPLLAQKARELGTQFGKELADISLAGDVLKFKKAKLKADEEQLRLQGILTQKNIEVAGEQLKGLQLANDPQRRLLQDVDKALVELGGNPYEYQPEELDAKIADTAILRRRRELEKNEPGRYTFEGLITRAGGWTSRERAKRAETPAAGAELADVSVSPEAASQEGTPVSVITAAKEQAAAQGRILGAFGEQPNAAPAPGETTPAAPATPEGLPTSTDIPPKYRPNIPYTVDQAVDNLLVKQGLANTPSNRSEIEKLLDVKRSEVTFKDSRENEWRLSVIHDRAGNVYSPAAPELGAPELVSMSPASQKADAAFAEARAKDLVEMSPAQLRTNAKQLQLAVESLGKTDLASGPIVSLIPDSVARRLPGLREGARIKAVVEGVVQQSLRQILGGAFAQKEGEQLLQRAYDPTAPEAENIRRAKVLLGTMREYATNKAAANDYFQRNGTLYGYNGPSEFTHQRFNDEFDRAISAAPDASKATKVSDDVNRAAQLWTEAFMRRTDRR